MSQYSGKVSSTAREYDTTTPEASQTFAYVSHKKKGQA